MSASAKRVKGRVGGAVERLIERRREDLASTTSSARVATDRPARYGKQLVGHMSRRFGGEWSDQGALGWLRLGEDGRADVRAEDGVLVLEVSAGSASELTGLEEAVGRHLVRFGARDELVVTWTRADGTAGSQQRVVG